MLQHIFCLVFLTIACNIDVSHEHPVTATSLRLIWLQVNGQPIPVVLGNNDKFMGVLDMFQQPQTSPQKSAEPTVPRSNSATAYSATSAKAPTTNEATKPLSNKAGPISVEPNTQAVVEQTIKKPGIAANEAMTITLTGKAVEISPRTVEQASGNVAVDPAMAKISAINNEPTLTAAKPTADSKLLNSINGKSSAKNKASAKTKSAPATTVAPQTTTVATTTTAAATTTAALTAEQLEMLAELEEMPTTPASNAAVAAPGGEPVEAP